MIILHDTVSILQIHVTAFNCFINTHHFFTIKKIIKKYNLNTTSLHISAQHANNLTAVTSIQNENIIMKDVNYSATIIYFKNLMKHLNVEEIISMIKTALFNNCFEK